MRRERGVSQLINKQRTQSLTRYLLYADGTFGVKNPVPTIPRITRVNLRYRRVVEKQKIRFMKSRLAT